MKIIFLITSILILSYSLTNAQITIPQLQAGIPVNDTIGMQSYQFAGYCDSLGANDVTISIASSLVPFVSGVEIKYVVAACPAPPDTAYCIQTGAVNVGDVFSFPSVSSSYTFYSTPYAGGISFHLVLSGTPTTPFEDYPCSLLTVITLADCANSMMNIEFGNTCLVNDFVGMNEISPLEIIIFPNPVKNEVEIKFPLAMERNTRIQFYDVKGRIIKSGIVKSGEKSVKFDMSLFPSGFYYIIANDGTNLSKSHTFVVSR